MNNVGAEAVDPLFVEHDLGESSGSAVDVARRAGYPWPEQMARKMLRNVEISAISPAINSSISLCLYSVYNENRTDTKDSLVLDKTRYQRHAVMQALAAQLGITHPQHPV